MKLRTRIEAAKQASQSLAIAPAPTRSGVLELMARALVDPQQQAPVLEANAQDMEEARALELQGKLDTALVKRLELTPAKLQNLAEGMTQLAQTPDRVGQILLKRELDEGLVLEQVQVPFGVLGAVFESRPDALPQIAGLALRSGNAAVLKGGSEARHSNRALTRLLHGALEECSLPTALITLLEDRSEVGQLLAMDRLVDLLIARGSGAFVRYIMDNTSIPVLGHAEGLCHLYLHQEADPKMAAAIAVDAKCSYPAACNAIETLLWHPKAEGAARAALRSLEAQGVTLLGDPPSQTLTDSPMAAATEEDWSTEYGTLTLSLRCVPDLDAALAHIQRYGSGHTEAIVTQRKQDAERFLASVDAADVFHNASSRFADGYRFGLGAEVGISTSKLHARGPVGVEGLLTTRWLLRGTGQVASEYGPKGKAFLHRDLHE